MKYPSLHHHSTFSYLDGFGLPETHVKRAADIDMPAIAMTEHGNVSSHVKLEKACKESGVKPIFGVELYTNIGPEPTQLKNHLTVLAENEEGYKNVLRIVSRAWADGFYYEPTATWDMMEENLHGLVILSGCLGSLLATSIVGGKGINSEDAGLERGLAVAKGFKRAFGDAYYLECQTFPELKKTTALNKALEVISKKLKIPLLATGDVHYTTPDESDMQMVLHNVRGGHRQSLEDQARAWGYDVKLCPPTTDRMVYEKLRATGLSKSAAEQAMLNATEVAERCTVELPKLTRVRYVPTTGEIGNSQQLWRQWLEDGWYYRGIHKKPNRREYVKRIRQEMEVIEGKDFIDYFLIVSDAVRFAKDSGIPVGPARGSAAGSLVCYLLRITEVDPMLYADLVFERFIDVTRMDLPDIDLDFAGGRRDEVRQYLVDKYGQERVGNVGTFTKYKSKNSLDDIARVYKIPQWEVDIVKDLIIERSGGDLRADETIEDTVSRFSEAKAVFDKHPDLWRATKLEGNIKGMGVHAAGLVVANEPITDAAAMYRKKVGKGKDALEVISVDKHDLEYLGMLKIDVLGLNTMDMIDIALGEIGMSLTELYSIPLDDEETIQGFKENDVVGIFQFDGRAMRDVCGGVKPDDFYEVALINALARPGPLHNGATSAYIDIKHGAKKPRKLHPIYDAITERTGFEIVFQEQILRICGEIGGFDHTHRTHIRKIISQRKGEQVFRKEWERFKRGALKHKGMTEEIAQEIWGNCVTSGAYAFNAAHSTSYGMLAFWTMWMKRHHPQAFYTAALQIVGKKEKQIRLLRDAIRHGVEIKPPHPRKSRITWRAEGDAIRAGLTQIPGIGEKTALSIRKAKPKKWDDMKSIRGIGPVTIKKIKEFTSKEDPFDVMLLHNRIASVTQQLEDEELGPLPEPTHQATDIPYTGGKDEQIIWLGTVTHRNLRNLWEVNQKRGIEIDPETVKSPHLDEWMIMQCEDETEVVTVTINRFKWPNFREGVWKIRLGHDLILVKGVKPGYMSARVIQVSELWVIDPDD